MNETPVPRVVTDSTVAGYLAPLSTAGDLEDLPLQRFFQQLVVNLTQLPTNLVRRRWQPEMPQQPELETNWSAIGVVNKTSDTYAFEGTNQDDSHYVLRHQVLEVLASFYGPNADGNSERFSLGFQLAQNRNVLLQNGFGFIECMPAITVPAMLHNRWVYGVDVRFRIKRAQKYTYQVLEITSAGLVLNIDDPIAAYPITIEGGS